MQPLGPFPANAKCRKFSNYWYGQFKWIEYDVKKDAIFCLYCRQVQEQKIYISSKSEDAFTAQGFKAWHKMRDKCDTHESSQAHRDSHYRFHSILSNENVLSRIQTQNAKERNIATECLQEIITSLLFLGRQGLAVRGVDDNNSNLKQLLNLRTRDNKDLHDWLQKATTWTSHDIQNEMLSLAANTIFAK